MWLKLVFIGCCAIGGILAAAAPEKNVTQEAVATKEKRQTDHETRTLPQGAAAAERRQQQQQQAYFQDPDVAAHYYAQQAGGQLLFRPHQPKAAASSAGPGSGQEQVQDLPPEYLSLIQQLADHQKHVAPAKHAKHHSYEPQNVQPEHQQQQQQQPQYYQPQQQQAHHQSPQHNQIQYITEEEYAQIVKQAQAQNHHAAAQAQQQQQQQHHQQHHQQQHQQPQYTRPAGKHELPKYRPTVQLLETGQEHGHAYSQPDPEQFRIQYKSIQPTGSVTPVSKPISAFSFEKELAKLVESNRPVAYHQAGGGHRQSPHESPRYVPSPQASAEYAYPSQNGHEHAPKQSIKAQYIAPFAQAYTGPKPNAAHLQVGPHKFAESPAQRYQFIAQEERAKSHPPQQYFTEVSPKHQTHSEEKTHAGAPSPKIQYYVPKEKNLQIYYPHQQVQEKQPVEQHTPSHPMKIVEAPQLQHEKPSKAQIQAHRQKAQYIAREKQAEQSQHSAQKSKEVEAPSRSAIYVSQQTGVSPSSAPSSAEKQAPPQQQQQQQQQHQHHKIPPKIDRPLTQEEFQALVDAGYSVVPVPVPVPVPISQYHAQQQAQQQRAAAAAGAASSGRHGPVAQASRYHQHQIAAAENNPSQVITYLRPLHIDPFSAGIRGPNKAAP
ncbi:putative mediator of RNA polymerase II transcription subunit 12 [Culex quinquefasciatus]|uniref:putative mediator of RNA polymerase II transcription subunit 12 n=1 Tax=Culex quinquefasciatus TaxID=7176 RepID=UPI0018E38915|nr:putative mediator of RNA polymerase II transcription subunit 12 [Culex quinquefasciatus]